MDQMVSTCGEKNRLMSMLCRPAELQAPLSIPAHISLWGIDSGIRHSVGGADYGSVRVGAFVGKTLMASEDRRAAQTDAAEPP